MDIKEFILIDYFQNLIKHFGTKKFYEDFDVNGGYAFKSSEYKADGIFVLRVSNMNADGSIQNTSDVKYISNSSLENYKEYQLEKNDVLMVMVGGSIGKTSIVSEDILPAVLNQNIWKICNKKSFNTKYVYYLIKYLNLNTQLRSSSFGHFSRKSYREHLIPNIETVISNEYGEELEKLMNNNFSSSNRYEKIIKTSLFKNNISTEITHQLDLIKNLRQAFLREAMQGVLVSNETSDNKTGADLLAEIQAKKAQLVKEKKIKKPKPLAPITEEEFPFAIPENWTWCRLGELCNYGSSPKIDPDKIDDEVWSLDLEDIEKITSKVLQKVKYKERKSTSTKSVFNKGQVLYSKLRPNLDKVIVADEDGVCTTEIIPITFYYDLNSYFVRYHLKSPQFLEFVVNSTKGMKMPRIGTEEVSNSLIPLPPLEIQERIVAKLDELMRYCDALEEQVKQSQQTNELLLQQVLREALGA